MNETVQEMDERKLVLARRQLGRVEVRHDSYDVEHGNMKRILGAYGIDETFDARQIKILRRELYGRARAIEIQEAELWAQAAEEREVAPWWLDDRPAPSPLTLRLQHRMWVAAKRAQEGGAQ
jgi:hypothetical protein